VGACDASDAEILVGRPRPGVHLARDAGHARGCRPRV